MQHMKMHYSGTRCIIPRADRLNYTSLRPILVHEVVPALGIDLILYLAG